MADRTHPDIPFLGEHEDGWVCDPTIVARLADDVSSGKHLERWALIARDETRGPAGIFVLVDRPPADPDGHSRQVRQFSFHYLDLRWVDERLRTKIMLQSHMSRFDDGAGGWSIDRNKLDGDVLGVMPGDFRECHRAIREAEQKRCLLADWKPSAPGDSGDARRLRINDTCGVGLSSLCFEEPILDAAGEHPWYLGIFRAH